MRIAYFGGSFDPPHRAHLAVALAAAAQFSLDRVLLAPTGRQPLKPQGSSASYADRLEMTRLLVVGQPRLETSEIDAPAGSEPNYTVDALAALHQALSEADELFALVGADALLHFPRWREPQQLLELAQWIVVSRPGLDSRQLVAEVIAPAMRPRVHLLHGVHDEVSATEIRTRLADGLPCEDLVPQAVLAYIQAHQLYTAAPEPAAKAASPSAIE